ncbi:MAG: aldo/keto reductase [Pirellulaceae bacterium]|nr:aldo/keto reductase [Pirellulaceae bacterium]
MIRRILGQSKLEVSPVAFGAWAIGGWMWGGADEKDATAAILAALDGGVNMIDTAPIYGFGKSEEIVGRAIAGRRDEVVLATKCGLVWDREEGDFYFHANDDGVSFRPSEKKVFKCLRPESIRAELEASLKRLGTDYIDLYQTHWQESTTPIADTVAELNKMKDEGKIRAVGVCNSSLVHLAAYGQIDSDQEKFSLLDREIEEGGSLAYCRRQGISMLAYSPLSNGLLTGKIGPDREFGPGDLRRGNRRFSKANLEAVAAMLEEIQPIAEKHKATFAQLAIAWTIAQPGVTVALCGARNAKQAAENAAAVELSLTPEELENIGKSVHF